MWSINSSKDEIILSYDSKELFVQWSKACGGVKSKNRHPSWLCCAVIGLSEVATWGVLCKSCLKHFAISTGNTCSLFEKVAGLKACNFIKKRHQHTCLPMNIAKNFKTTYFEKHLLAAAFWLFPMLSVTWG